MKTTLVTGANRGLGLGFTRHYLKRGDRVFSCARDWSASAEAADLAGQFGERFYPLTLDVSDERAIAELPDMLGGATLDLVLNNAGTCPDEGFGAWAAKTFETAMAVNCTGPALVAQALAPLLAPGAPLVNISSGLASMGLNINPETGLDAYAASKSALNMVTRRLAAKPAFEHVVVVAIDPGWVRTRMGGEQADLAVEESIRDITATIERLGPEDSGLFFSRGGDALPW